MKKKEMINKWMELDADESRKVFRQTFGKDYEHYDTEKELDLMDRDVKKAPLWQLHELMRHAGIENRKLRKIA